MAFWRLSYPRTWPTFLFPPFVFPYSFMVDLPLYQTAASCCLSFVLRQTTKVLYRNEAEPLIDYAQRLEAFYPLFHGDFIRLTQQYEAYLYSQEQPAGQEAFLKQVAAQISQLKNQLSSEDNDKNVSINRSIRFCGVSLTF